MAAERESGAQRIGRRPDRRVGDEHGAEQQQGEAPGQVWRARRERLLSWLVAGSITRALLVARLWQRPDGTYALPRDQLLRLMLEGVLTDTPADTDEMRAHAARLIGLALPREAARHALAPLVHQQGIGGADRALLDRLAALRRARHNCASGRLDVSRRDYETLGGIPGYARAPWWRGSRPGSGLSSQREHTCHFMNAC